MTQYTGGTSARGYYLRAQVYELSTNSVNNTSVVRVDLYLGNGNNRAFDWDSTGFITLNGITKNFTANNWDTSTSFNSIIFVITKDFTITHEQDGSSPSMAFTMRWRNDTQSNSFNVDPPNLTGTSTDVSDFTRTPDAPAAKPTLTRATSGTTATILSATATFPTATPAATITSYQYQQSTTTSFTGATAVTMATPPAATTLTGLTATQRYYYQTRAVNVDGNGPWSATAVLPPAQPTNLTGATATATTVALDWDGQVTSLERYKVEYKQAVDPTFVNSGYTGTTSAYTVTGLSQNTIYDFRVLTENPTDSLSSGYATLSRATLPSTPTNLSVVSFTANEVALNWDDNPVGFTSYKVEFKLSADATWTNTGYVGTTSAYTVTGLAFNSEYNFRVSVLNASNSTQSDFATATQTTLPAGPPVRINSTTWAPSEVYVRTASAWTLGAMYVWDGTAWKVVG